MTDEPEDFCPRGQNGGDGEQPDPSERGGDGSESPIVRTEDGRFAPGHCPNRKGRPRKRTATPADIVHDILNEKMQVNVGGTLKPMSIYEGLVRAVATRGFKDPGIAMAILKFALANPPQAKEDEEQSDDAEDDAAFERYLERQLRRRRLRETDTPDDDEEGGS